MRSAVRRDSFGGIDDTPPTDLTHSIPQSLTHSIMPRMERDTKQRQAIRHAFEAADWPMGPPEVLEIAKTRSPGIGIRSEERRVGKEGRARRSAWHYKAT